MTNPSRKRVPTLDDLNVLNQNAAYARQKGEAADAAATRATTAADQAEQAASALPSLTEAANLLGDAREAAGYVVPLAAAKQQADITHARANADHAQTLTGLSNLAQTSAYLVSLSDLAGRVDTVAELPGGQPNGTQYMVAETGTVWRVESSAWVDTGFGVATVGQPRTAHALGIALDEMRAAPPTAWRRLTARLAAGETAIIVLLSDSTGEGADQVGYGLLDSYAVRLQRWCDQVFGVGRVQVINLSLGQRRIDHLNDPNYRAQATEPANIETGFGPRSPGDRPWAAANVGQSWAQIAQESNPDLVLLWYGMNRDASTDPAYTFGAYLRNVLTTIQATWWQWNGMTPDVMVGTPMQPSDTYPRPADETRAIAEVGRSVAHAQGLAVADANRLSNLLQYGLDPATLVSTAYRTLDLSVDWDGATGAWVRQGDGTYARAAAGSTGYVRLAGQRPDGEFRVFAAFGADNELLNVVLREGVWGRLLLQWSGHTVQIVEQPAGGIGGQTVLAGDTWAPTLAAGGTWANAGQSLYVTLDGPQVVVLHNGRRVTARSLLGLSRAGDVRLGTLDAGYVLPARLLGFEVITREPLKTAPTANQALMLGAAGHTPGSSGNALNHPTAEGYALMYHAATVAALSSLTDRVTAAGNVGDVETTIAAPYAAGWGDLGGYVPAQISKRGSRVEMSGNSIRAAGGGATALTLPVGYRPPTSYLIRVNTQAGLLVATVQADGQIVFADAVPDGAWIAWSGVEWRTS